MVRSDSRTVGGSVHTGRRGNTTVILNNRDTARVWEDDRAPGRSPVTPMDLKSRLLKREETEGSRSVSVVQNNSRLIQA